MKFNDTDIIRNFFTRQVKQFGDHVYSLAWESDYTQEARFWALQEISNINGSSVLDVGCGKADMFRFFCDKGIDVDYYGVDLTRDLIEVGKKKYPELDLYYRDFMEEKPYPPVDFVLASGVANVKTPNNQSYMQEMIRKMYKLAGKGVAVNMLSTFSPSKQKRDNLCYLYSPELMLKFALILTPKVIVRHDYLPNDFTLYLYKNRPTV